MAGPRRSTRAATSSSARARVSPSASTAAENSISSLTSPCRSGRGASTRLRKKSWNRSSSSSNEPQGERSEMDTSRVPVW
jgi:hypothetical protein